MKARYVNIAAVFVATILVVLVVPVAWAASRSITLQPGDTLRVTCSSGLSGSINSGVASLACKALATLTPTPRATSIPPIATATAVPPTGGLCPQSVHDAYTTTGPDGKQYPTWHPPVDPLSDCFFGHEHGADPRTSHAANDLPPFGYAAAVMGMDEPHTGFKVFVMNAGDTVESSVNNKIADEDIRFVFHMGTSGVGRYTTQMHSLQIDYVDRNGSGRYAHLTGMADTGPTSQDGNICDLPRKGAKDFSDTTCAGTYEIWNATRLQIMHPDDPFMGINESRFGMAPSFAVFDPITTRDPADNTRLLYTEDVKGTNHSVPPTSPLAESQGCQREFYAGPLYFHNAGQPSSYFTDAMGHVNPSGQDAAHPIQQILSPVNGEKTAIYKLRTDYCDGGIRSPN